MTRRETDFEINERILCAELPNLVVCPNPFTADQIKLKVTQGLTIRQMIEVAQPDGFLRRYAYVEIHGEPIPEEWWDRIRPKAGTLVNIRVIPQGGGGRKDTLRIVLTIAVIAAAVAFAQPLGAALVGKGGLSLGAGITISATALGGALISPGRALSTAPMRRPS